MQRAYAELYVRVRQLGRAIAAEIPPMLRTCQWCRKLIWIRSRDRMHLRCAADVDRIYLQGQEVTGI